MKAVVLAAGDGGRLRPFTDSCSKVLLPIAGRPLISYPISAILEQGIKEIGVIVGHQANQVVELVPKLVPSNIKITFINNPHYDGGNAISVYMAKDFIGSDSFLVSMGDHMIEPEVMERMVSQDAEFHLLGIDSIPSMESQINDATRVLIDEDGSLLKIGKELKTWNAVDIGVFKFTSAVFNSMETLYSKYGNALELNQLMQFLAEQEPAVDTCDVEGLYWNDIDTIEDYVGAGGNRHSPIQVD